MQFATPTHRRNAMAKKVTYSALVKRINRKLVHQNELLKKCSRRSRWLQELGDYYVVGFISNFVRHKDVDPLELARELGVLQPHEEVDGA